MSGKLRSKRYEPPMDLNNMNNSQTLTIILAGENKKILEVGTSTGYVSRILKDHGNVVTGIEIDREAAEIATQYCDSMIIEDVEAIDLADHFKEASFDVIILSDILEHLKNPERLIVNLKKFLKPDGYLIVSLPNFCHGDVLLKLLNGDFKYTSIGLLDETHIKFFAYRNILELFNRSGYEVTDIHTTTIPVGSTEQRMDIKNVPNELLNFITSLPDSNIYQYVFKAVPIADIKISSIPYTPIEQLFKVNIEAPIKIKCEEQITELTLKNQEQAKCINELTLKNQEQAKCIKEQNESIKSLELNLNERDSRLLDLSDRLQRSSNNIAALENEISSMRRSIVWQMLMKFQRGVIDRFLPLGKRRRKAYDLALTGGRIIVNEGPVAFLTKLIGFFKRNEQKVDDYERWILKNEPTPKELRKYRNIVKNLKLQPRISIITPVYNPDVAWIKAAIESVLKQAYGNWELCIADASTKEDVRECLKAYARRDRRIKVKFLTQNSGISGNSNEALSLATGDFICFLDHDDEISPFALYEVIKQINNNPDLDLIYSDEDKLDINGKRCDAFFKPDWSLDLLHSCMYTCHLSVYRKSIIEKIGGFRLGYEGSQDYDLALRFIEYTSPDKIAHIPKILYHWRKVPGSIASDPIAKNCVNIVSGKKALADLLERQKIDGMVEDGKWLSSYRLRRSIIGCPKVSIIIPTRDHVELLKKCIDSIKNLSTYKNYEIIIVNNNSEKQETIEYIKSLDCLRIDYNDEFNFSRINNLAVRKASGEYLIFLNNDVEIITGDWIESLLENAQRKEVGAVGCKLLYPDRTIQHAGVILGLSPDPRNKVAGHIFIMRNNVDHGYFGIVDTIRNYSAVTAAAMMVRKEVFEEVGGFDECLKISYNDVDLCLKMRKKNYLIVYTPFVELIHYESASRGHYLNELEVNYMMDKWGSLLQNDPYYNPNLSLKKVNCEINV